jgi:hypothetical protein
MPNSKDVNCSLVAFVVWHGSETTSFVLIQMISPFRKLNRDFVVMSCSEIISKNIQIKVLPQKTSEETNSQTSEVQRFQNCYEEISLLGSNSSTSQKTTTEATSTTTTTTTTEVIEPDDDIDHIARRLYEHESFVAFGQIVLAGSYFVQGDISTCLQHLILVLFLSLSLFQYILF